MSASRLQYQAIYDISILLGVESVVFPTIPAFSMRQGEVTVGDDVFRSSDLAMSAHRGTHLDAPAHLASHKRSIDQYPLESFILPALVANITDEEAIRVSELRNLDITPGDALLFRTKNSLTGLSVCSAPSESYVYMTAEAAALCAQRSVALVGFDYFVGEKAHDGSNAIHRTLFEKDILILEGANLKDVPPGRYTMFCLPLKMKGCEASPVRAILLK
jgi:arylformamidase